MGKRKEKILIIGDSKVGLMRRMVMKQKFAERSNYVFCSYPGKKVEEISTKLQIIFDKYNDVKFTKMSQFRG